MVVVLVAQVSQPKPVQEITMVVLVAIHLALINAIVVIVVIVQAAIVVINVQIAKLVTHNAIQIISDYFYALLYCFLQLILIHINYLLIV